MAAGQLKSCCAAACIATCTAACIAAVLSLVLLHALMLFYCLQVHCYIALCMKRHDTVPEWEEMCALAGAVQNMQLQVC